MRLGVAGWPVSHSRSPAIQNAALRLAGLDDWRYQLLPLPPALFEETVHALPGAGFRGINITIPHKQRALALTLEAGGAVSDQARAIGAANTLVFGPDRALAADNTDAPALVRAMPTAPAGLTALILGAGGSARAAAWALLDAGAAEVRVWNRTAARARELCDSLKRQEPDWRLVAVPAAGPADVLVNCTSVGLEPPAGDELSALPVAPGLPFEIVVDFVYRGGGTALIRAARSRGIPAVDGRELLVGQGALSFEQFTGRPAPFEAMRAAAGLDGGAGAVG